MTTSPGANRVLALDVLRSIAIVLVVLRHGISVPGLTELESSFWRIPYQVARNGWLGVDLFFVLSGFLIAGQILREVEATGRLDWRSYLLRRALRTLPAYYFVLLVLWAGVGAAVLGTEGVGEPRVLLAHLLFLNDYVQPAVLVTFWSLATEEKFYLAMVVILPFLARARVVAAMAVLLGAVTISIARAHAFTAVEPATYPEFFWSMRAPFHFAVEGLLLGTGVALIKGYLRVSPLTSRTTRIAGTVLACVVVMFNGWNWNGELEGAVIAIPAFSVAIALLLLATADHSSVRTRPNLFGSSCTWLASISFSLYLTHFVVVKLLVTLAPEMASSTPFLYWVAYLIGSVCTGYALHLLAEKPGLRLRDRILSGRRLAANQAAADVG